MVKISKSTFQSFFRSKSWPACQVDSQQVKVFFILKLYFFTWSDLYMKRVGLKYHIGSKAETVAPMCSVKKVLLTISQNSQENTYARVSFLIKLQALGLQLYWKTDSGTGVFLWICEIFKKIFFHRTSPVAASAKTTKEGSVFEN